MMRRATPHKEQQLIVRVLQLQNIIQYAAAIMLPIGIWEDLIVRKIVTHVSNINFTSYIDLLFFVYYQIILLRYKF